MRRNILDTIYRVIDHSSNEINKLLDLKDLNATHRHIFNEYVDDLKDGIEMLDRIGEEEILMKLKSHCHGEMHSIDKPIIMKKTSISVEKQ